MFLIYFIRTKKDSPFGFADVRNRGCQTLFRESEAQTGPWRPPYIGEGSELPESIDVDRELKFATGNFGQYEVDIVKRFRKRKEWEKYLNKIYSPETADLQKRIVEELEEEKWYFVEKDLDNINQLRLELAKQELDEQSRIIQERMEYRMRNALKKYEELKKRNGEKFQAQLEREIRRSKLIADKWNRFPMNGIKKKIYNPLPSHLYKPKIQHEILCPEAIPTTLNDAYMMLERNLISSKPLKKTLPSTHDCNIPKFYEVPPQDEGFKILEEKQKREDMILEKKEKCRAKMVSSSKALIAALVAGRATQTLIHKEAKMNFPALYKKYANGKKLYESGIKEFEDFQIAVAEGIRDYNMTIMMKEKIQSIIRHLEGRTISNRLDFVSKEFLRLQEQRRLLTLADVAERERWTREALESGRRQEEEQRLLQHEEMYKEVMKTHEISSDALLESVLGDEMEKTNSSIATVWTRVVAEYYKDIFGEPHKTDPYRRLEYVSRLADRCLSTQSENAIIKMQNQHNMHTFGKAAEDLVGGLLLSLPDTSSELTLSSDQTGPFDAPEAYLSAQGDGTTTDVDEESSPKSEATESSETRSTASSLVTEPEKKDEEESERDELEINDLADKLLNQIIDKADGFMKKFQENMRKDGHQAEVLQKGQAEYLSDAYQLLVQELLKNSANRSKDEIEKKVRPWVDLMANEATKRMSNILFKFDDIDLDDILDEEERMAYFYADDIYDCPVEKKLTPTKKVKKEPLTVVQTSLEYEGILDEKIDEIMTQEEDKLKNISMKKKL